ncbi:S24 family peptidase [Tenacibaculum sp. 190524A02b]|uniref:S24 family peptidase n=1 Tax=Tenacibaculum vairaonense TaxID=3137860 RepID=UPI0031FB7DFF
MDFIEAIEILNNEGVTAYEINKATGLNEAGIRRVLNGNVTNPQRKTKDILIKFAEGLKKPIHNDTEVPFNVENVVFVPFVSQRDKLEYIKNLNNQQYLDNLPKEPWLADKSSSNNYLSFEVFDDSMVSNGERDSLLQNDILLCKEIHQKHWDRLPIHQYDFIIVHKTEGVLCRRITNSENEQLTLHPLNPLYEDSKINLKDVVSIFNILNIKRLRRRM